MSRHLLKRESLNSRVDSIGSLADARRNQTREVVILDVGMNKFGISGLTMKETFAEAALEALEE